MSTEYGVFNSEGLVEGQIWSEIALASLVDDYRQDAVLEDMDPTDIYGAEVCVEHEDQPSDSCEICWAEEEEDES